VDDKPGEKNWGVSNGPVISTQAIHGKKKKDIRPPESWTKCFKNKHVTECGGKNPKKGSLGIGGGKKMKRGGGLPQTLGEKSGAL